MAQKSSGNVSIANILALAGLAGVGVITFFGMLLHSSDGKPAGAIVGAVALVAVLGFLLFMSIKAKGAEDNPDKWKYVEWGCLLAYVVVAVAFARPFQRFFYIIGEKDTLQAEARQEVKQIKSLYQNYDQQQKKFLDQAVQQIQNYRASGQGRTVKDDLSAYVDGVGDNVDGWAAKASIIVKLPKDKQLMEIEDKIDAWNLMQLASIAASLEAKDTEAWKSLQKKIDNYGEQNKLIPVIGGGGGKPYRLEGMAEFDLGQPAQAKFAKTLRSANGNTAMGWIIYVVLNLLVLLNYVVASRTGFVGPTSHDNQSVGLDL